MVEICMLGSGATMPVPQCGLSSAILRCCGRSILFDCGEGTQVALRREHFNPLKIDLIALSHYHGDHIFGLPGLLQTMNCLNRSTPLVITGPEAPTLALAPILQLAGSMNYEIRCLSLPPEGLNLNTLHASWPAGARILPVPTQHRVPSNGFLFSLDRRPRFDAQKADALKIPVSARKQLIAQPDQIIEIDGVPLFSEGRPLTGRDVMGKPRKGLRVLFSGDTFPCDSVQNAAQGADLLIHDATYAEDKDTAQAELYGHSTFRQAATLAAQAGVKTLWLTHFSQAIDNPSEQLSTVSSLFPNTYCSFDGMKTVLDFPE